MPKLIWEKKLKEAVKRYFPYTVNLVAEKPLNKYIKCSLNSCGCRTISFIWISKKHKIIFFEIAKCGSSSIKKALDIKGHPYDTYYAYYWQKLNNTNPKILFKRGIKGLIIKTIIKLNFLIRPLKVSNNPSLGIKRGIYEFQPYFSNLDNLLQKYPDFLYVANIRDPLKRFISCFNMFSDKDQPFRQKQRADIGKSVKSAIENLDFFIESSVEEPNHHFWPYSKLINKIKDVDKKLIISCDEISKNWHLIKSRLNLPNIQSNAPVVYVSNSKSNITKSHLSKVQIEKIENIYEDDLKTYQSIIAKSC